mgnify:CR=1 FL=1
MANNIDECIVCPATVADIDGHVYPVVKIGNQCWMGENLGTKRYNNGGSIGIFTDGIEWAVSGNADVINMSLGADGSMGEEDDYLFLRPLEPIDRCVPGNNKIDKRRMMNRSLLYIPSGTTNKRVFVVGAEPAFRGCLPACSCHSRFPLVSL